MKNDFENDKISHSQANFIVIEDSIYKDLRLTANDVLIYGLINALSNNEEKQCYAQNKRLAAMRNLTIRQIQNSIRKLKILNYIVVSYDENNHNVRYIRTYLNQKIIERDKNNKLQDNQLSIDDLDWSYDWLNDDVN